jgi:hypothetical protein
VQEEKWFDILVLIYNSQYHGHIARKISSCPHPALFLKIYQIIFYYQIFLTSLLISKPKKIAFRGIKGLKRLKEHFTIDGRVLGREVVIRD